MFITKESREIDCNWTVFDIKFNKKRNSDLVFVGKMRISSCDLTEFDNCIEVLNKRGGASAIADLFESKCTLKEENEIFLYSHYGTDTLLFSKVYILESVEIAEGFDLQSTLYLFFKSVFLELGVDKEECAFFVHINKLDNSSVTKEKSNLLCNDFIFQNLGFLKIMQKENDSLLIHNTALSLKTSDSEKLKGISRQKGFL